MELLPSGLPEIIADHEVLARFLTSSSQYNSTMVKPSAFLPEPEYRETSVFRHDSEPRPDFWAIGLEHIAQGRTLHGAALLTAKDVRVTGLDVRADEPPPRHAAIRNWPWIHDDPDERKAQHKKLALLLATNAKILRR
jgi:hypothetical protein